MRRPINLALLLATLTAPVFAAAPPSLAGSDNAGYLRDSSQHVVQSSAGDCWHTGTWTPADATVIGCDGVLAKAVPVPAPAPPAETTPPPPPPAVKPEPPLVVPPPPQPGSEKVTFDTDTFFDFDKAVLKQEGKNKLTELVSRLSGMTVEVIVAEGHTDSVGTDTYNQKLSERRAQAVKDFLLTQNLPAERIYIRGKGEKQPVGSNKTRHGRAKNRRVEVEVVGVRKR
jgi:OOP family OmpA-OmpF porin